MHGLGSWTEVSSRPTVGPGYLPSTHSEPLLAASWPCYAVTPASNGLQAWSVLESCPMHFDLVLTDVVMPGLSGIGLLSRIVATEVLRRLPVISTSSCLHSSKLFLPSNSWCYICAKHLLPQPPSTAAGNLSFRGFSINTALYPSPSHSQHHPIPNTTPCPPLSHIYGHPIPNVNQAYHHALSSQLLSFALASTPRPWRPAPPPIPVPLSTHFTNHSAFPLAVKWPLN